MSALWRLIQVVTWTILSLGLLSFVPTHAQPPVDSVRLEAQQDFHGPDLQGKDGPLAKAGQDLLILYHRHRKMSDTCSFPAEQTALPVSENHVTIDALAATQPAELRRDLERLGLKNSAVAGRIVSGRLPISQIPSMAKLESLQRARPAQRSTPTSPRLPPAPSSPGQGIPSSPDTSSLLCPPG